MKIRCYEIPSIHVHEMDSVVTEKHIFDFDNNSLYPFVSELSSSPYMRFLKREHNRNILYKKRKKLGRRM